MMKNLIILLFICTYMIMMMINAIYSGSSGLEGLQFDPDYSPLLDSPMVDDVNEGDRPWKVEEPSILSNTNNTVQGMEDCNQSQMEEQLDDKNEEDRLWNVGQSSQLTDIKYTFQGIGNWDQSEKEKQFYQNDNKWPELKIINNKAEASQLCVNFSSWMPVTPSYIRKCHNAYQLNYDSKRKRTVLLQNRTYIIERVMLSCTCFDQKVKGSYKEFEETFLVAKHNDTSYYLLKNYEEKKLAYIFGYVENFKVGYSTIFRNDIKN